jgi:Poly(ADP-ribose) polymerase catalytic domain
VTRKKTAAQLDREIVAALTQPERVRRVTAYHGTRRASTILAQGFLPSTGGEFGPGIYFSENPDTAAYYALHVARGDEEPMILTTTVDVSRFFEIRKVDWIQRTQRRTPRTVQAELRRRGYTGIIGIAINEYERQIVAFDTSSIVGPVRIFQRAA